jgi:endonuclease/exonuclease/phosphatase family metal-dependent hydrolase
MRCAASALWGSRGHIGMRLACYNVENLFSRARALNLDSWAEGRKILEKYAELNALFEEATYTDEIKARILDGLKLLGIDKKNDAKFAILRENRGQLAQYSTLKGTRIVANGRADWVGWLELKTELINETATRNTAQVIRDVDADVIGLVECEDRRALMQLSSKLLPSVGAAPYEQVMLIDGNDDRGIDVGLMTKRGHQVGWLRSHVDDVDANASRIFSRDCPEYSVWTPSGEVVWVLLNHLKSKGYGTQEGSDARRWRQAEQVRQIYQRLKSEGARFITVMGDLNDTPDSQSLAPLLKETDLKDISEHQTFIADNHPGTYQSGNARDKIDYILLSPALFERMQQGGVWRRGVWGNRKTPAWEVYPEMKTSYHAASDHAALWVDVAV